MDGVMLSSFNRNWRYNGRLSKKSIWWMFLMNKLNCVFFFSLEYHVTLLSFWKMIQHSEINILSVNPCPISITVNEYYFIASNELQIQGSKIGYLVFLLWGSLVLFIRYNFLCLSLFETATAVIRLICVFLYFLASFV